MIHVTNFPLPEERQRKGHVCPPGTPIVEREVTVLDAHRSVLASRRIVLITAIGFVIPFIVHWMMGGDGQAFRYQAADAFYYHTVALNIVDHHVIGFDQIHASNGFHPLWQAIDACLYAVGKFFPNPRQALLVLCTILNLAMLTTAVSLIAGLVTKQFPKSAPLIVFLPVGVYGLLGSAFIGSRALLWSQINGLESSLSVFCFVVWLVHRAYRPQAPWRSGFYLSLVILSRLDTVFILPAIALGELAFEWSQPADRLKNLLRMFCIPFAATASYLAANWFYCGALLPVSGAAKSSFPALQQGNVALILNNIVSSSAPHFHRLFGLLVPLLSACCMLPIFWCRKNSLYFILNVFVALRHLHDLLFVSIKHIGEWYYPISQIIMTISILACIDTSMRGMLRRPTVMLGVLFGAECLLFFTLFAQSWKSDSRRWKVYQSQSEIASLYRSTSPRFIALDDGIAAFAFGYPTLSGIGLNLDPRLAKSFKHGTLLEDACRAGFDRIILSEYGDLSYLTSSFTPQEQSRMTRQLRGFGLYHPGAKYQIEFLSPDRSFAILKITGIPDA
ncbi:hypothetical protein IT570_01955 [Candidatus Sumerlaeota bacterium]|nr:hypothetical protein [Candidatus Sumerlaeota bacterium]